MKKSEVNIFELQKRVHKVFLDAFGRTPFNQRIEDIQKESTLLCRFTDFQNLKEETGDLLSTVIELCNENEWQVQDLVNSTLEKIKRRRLQYKSLGRRTAVALLGGAFNPPTIGHIKLAQFVLNSSKTFDQVWICPCYGHMYGKKMASSKDRLEMCRIAAKADGRIKVFDYEIKHKLKGETYNFLKSLFASEYIEEYDFSYVIGIDNANTFDKWVNFESLEHMIRFVVVNRKGFKRNKKVNWYLKHPHIFLDPENNEIPDTSSTQARDILKTCVHFSESEEELLQILDRNVLNYIWANCWGKYYEEKY